MSEKNEPMDLSEWVNCDNKIPPFEPLLGMVAKLPQINLSEPHYKERIKSREILHAYDSTYDHVVEIETIERIHIRNK